MRLTVTAGMIARIETGTQRAAGDEAHAIAVPGMPNVHSHTFQRGMAGLAEVRGPANDSFWTWRELMYRFIERLNPEEFEAIAALAFAEMLEAGFTRAGEFHYLHRAAKGAPYANVAEMAARLAAAAEATGIGLTLLPVFYAHSGFGGLAPKPSQRRFVHDVDGFARLLAASREAVAPLGDAVVGVAPHSLRAVTEDELTRVAALAEGAPVHIHIAEQMREVDDCIAWSRQAPGRMAARSCPRRCALVSGARHPHDGSGNRAPWPKAARSPGYARSPRPISATVPFPRPRFFRRAAASESVRIRTC